MDIRKIKKPLMERKRRERINKALSHLKLLLLEHIRLQGGTQTAKLDKADILEMTVNYFNVLRKGQQLATLTNDKFIFNNGNHGYNTETLINVPLVQQNTSIAVIAGESDVPMLDCEFRDHSSSLERAHQTAVSMSSCSSMFPPFYTPSGHTVTDTCVVDQNVSKDKIGQRTQPLYTLPGNLSMCQINRMTHNSTTESIFWRPW